MKVFFGVPTYRGLRCVPMIDALRATIDVCQSKGIAVALDKQEGCCYIQVSRNEIVKDFLESGADCLFFVDDDLEWNPDDAIRLIEAPDDLVAGVYPKKSETEDYPVVIRTNPDGIPLVRPDGWISAPFLPTGFMRIRRNVIEKLYASPDALKYTKPDGEEMVDLFPQGVYGGRWWGEDFAFCRLWQNTGGQSWIWPDMTFSHHGTDKDGKPKVWTGNYHDFLLRCPGGSKA